MNRLTAAARQIRRSGVLDELTAMSENGIAIRHARGVHGAAPGRVAQGDHRVHRLDPRFWLSLMVLHAFLKRLDTHIIYLNDLRQLIFFDGLETVAEGYGRLLDALLKTVNALGAEEIHVMGNSAGGFSALRYAADLHAKTFLGTSIRSDLSADSSLPMGDFFRSPTLDAFPQMKIDLKPLLAYNAWPERIMLFCGEDNPVDLPHALHLADLPNVEITTLAGYAYHDVISGLLGRGMFEDVLRRFIDPGPIEKSIKRI